jgi:hypothetical protein
VVVNCGKVDVTVDVKIKVLAPWVVVIRIVEAACVDVSTKVLAPCVVVIKSVEGC